LILTCCSSTLLTLTARTTPWAGLRCTTLQQHTTSLLQSRCGESQLRET
jgi:hypothetical protein